MSDLTRADLEGEVVMVFSAQGNALDAFDHTPEALEEAARKLRKALGESTTITLGPSEFITGQGGGTNG